MIGNKDFLRYWLSLSVLILVSCSSEQMKIVIDDADGMLGTANAPVSFEIKLDQKLVAAAKEGRLCLIEGEAKNRNVSSIPVQLESPEGEVNAKIVWIMPVGDPGHRGFVLVESNSECHSPVEANKDPETGQVSITENDKNILQYNYQTVFEKDVIRPVEEQLEQHTRTESDTFVTTSIYAVPRSDYIHPLYGLNEEMLTRDWPIGGHPHHRAIFWGWPEVEYGSEMGDIYALQRIFARPTGNIEFVSGPVFAQITAENLWMWEDTEPIVREHAVIRVYRAAIDNRIIDLTIKLEALKDSITIATRNTDSYGGLNLRMMTPEFQEISYFADKEDANPRRAWSDFNGIFEGEESTSGLMVLQYQDNPDYPGQWVEYPDLAWVQPTFPAPGTRYPLKMNEPLVLRYRLIIHSGGKPDINISKKRWDAYHDPLTPIYEPD